MQNIMHPLQNKHILVTRPLQQATALCQLIEQQGGHAVLLPTMTIKNNDPERYPILATIIKNIAQHDIAIFISANAVQSAHQLMQKYAITWPQHLAIAAVGASTAQTLATLGLFVNLIPEQFNSEALLALPALQAVQGKRIIIFRGEGGRELLNAVLRERGAQLTEAIVYRRALPVIDIQNLLPGWQTGGLDIIVCTSNTGLQNLVTMVGMAARNWLMNMPLLVISERIAQFARELGFVKMPIVADNATDEAIVRALIDSYKS